MAGNVAFMGGEAVARNEASAVTAGMVVQTSSIERLSLNMSPIGVPHPAQLPPDVSSFTGRAEDLARLDSLFGEELSAGGPRSTAVVITAIAGAGGIGKTALAVHWAHRVRGSFPDGQLYVNLQGYGSGLAVNPDRALDGFLRGLGVPAEAIPADLEAKTACFRSLLADRRMLVILDNAVTADQVRPLLPGTPACAVVVTSRNRMSALVARDGAQRITLDQLTPAEAGQLLREVIGSARADGEPEAVAELARYCDFIPLALRIAADRVAARTHLRIADLVRDLVMEHHRLDVLAAGDDETTTLRSVFSWSYQTLPPETARVFRLLGLHPGFTISTAAAAVLTGMDAADAGRRLDALTDVHLLTEVGMQCYQFHDLLRAYAAERAVADESPAGRHEALRQEYDWYLQTANAALRAFWPQHPEVPISPLGTDCAPATFADPDQALRWFDSEHTNVIAVIHRAAVDGYPTVAWQMPNAVDAYLGLRYQWAERIAVHRVGLAVAQRMGDKLGERWAECHLGEALGGVERYDESLGHLRRALSLAKSIEDKEGEAAALVDLGQTYAYLKRFDEAVDHLNPSLDLYRRLGNRRGVGLALWSLAGILREQELFNEAFSHARLAMDIFQETGNRWNEASAWRMLGSVHQDIGQVEEAIDHLQRAVAIYQVIENRESEGEVLDQLGVVLHGAGRASEARLAWRTALAVLDALGHPQAADVRARLATGEGDG